MPFVVSFTADAASCPLVIAAWNIGSTVADVPFGPKQLVDCTPWTSTFRVPSGWYTSQYTLAMLATPWVSSTADHRSIRRSAGRSSALGSTATRCESPLACVAEPGFGAPVNPNWHGVTGAPAAFVATVTASPLPGMNALAPLVDGGVSVAFGPV